MTISVERKPAIFLDRDDTINRNFDLPNEAWEGVVPGDLLKPEYAILIDGVPDALIALKDAGYTLVVITNQGGVARAGGTMHDVDACNDRLRNKIHHNEQPKHEDDELALFDDQLIVTWYSCPFHPKTGVLTHLSVEHEWRKPHPGMIVAACKELNLDPARSWMVGDKQRDLDAAIAAGVPASQTIRVAHESPVTDLAHAARLILDVEEDPNQDQEQISSVTIHPLNPYAHPLADERVRATVEACARAIAERTGVPLLSIELSDSSVSATLAIHKIGALAFMAQLRRDTNRWHRSNHNTDLWPSANDPMH
ncbi:MAG: HAD-IIIA family hydrolase [Phycisphaerales bacterium]|nr:HAD-IIIA family hydrolase [Phycisphaerales bacterium]